MISDEELQKLSIGELKPHNAPITLVEYDLSWPRLFACEADRIRIVLDGTAMRIEHVGSTSVPGLAAKPIIDILLVVNRPEFRTSFRSWEGWRDARQELRQGDPGEGCPAGP